MQNMFQQAQKYVKEFGWSVIPLKPNSKEPLLKWQSFQERLPTIQELEEWFKETKNGLGIVTGSLSNLTVVDADSEKAMNSLKVQGIHSPVTAKSPKGFHIYFKYQKDLSNHVRILEDVDIRSEGGFVCASPTANYRWINPYFNTSHVRNLPNFPLHILPTKTEVKRNHTGWIAETLSNLKEGNRDASFTKVIGRLHYDGYSSSDIIALLAPYALHCGFGDTALADKVEHITTNYDNKNDKKQEETTDDSSDSLSDFLMDVRPIEWIVSPIIGRGTLVFMAGLPETLKTWLCADLAIEVSRGGTWLGRPVNKGKVLFVDQERYKTEVQRRFKLLMSEKGLEAKDLEDNLVIKSQTTTRIDLDESFKAFHRKLSEIKPDLVIIDSFATFHTREENNRKDVQAVLERVKELRTEFGCTIMFIDHESKSVFDKDDAGQIPNAFKITGSIGKPAAAETVFTVRKVSENEVIVYHTKSTISPTIEPIKVMIQDTEKGVKVA